MRLSTDVEYDNYIPVSEASGYQKPVFFKAKTVYPHRQGTYLIVSLFIANNKTESEFLVKNTI